MTITNLRLLEGIGQALQVITANSSDAMTKAQVHAASIAVDELRRRDDPQTLITRYARGRALVGALLDEAGDAGLRNAFATLPAAIDPAQSWPFARQQMDALLGVAEQIASQSQSAATGTLSELLAWEAEGYAFPRPPIAGASSAAITAEAVEAFIRSQGGDYADAKLLAFSPLAGGFSKQTILLDVETAKHRKESFALRGDGATKVLGLRGQAIPNEYHLLRYAFAGGVLCAEPMWLNALGPRQYFISRQCAGRNIGDGIQGNDDIPDITARTIAEAIAKIHQLPIDQSNADIQQSHLAANGPLTRYEAQKRFIDEWLAVWKKNGIKSPIAARAFKWVLDNLPRENAPATLVHCDYGFNNLLFDDGRLSAVLDWEISHLGDPAEDLGWLMFQIKNPETRQRLLKYYKDAGGPAEADPFRLKFYDVVTSMKMIIAMNDIGEVFQRVPDATVHLCSYAVPYLQGPLTAISQQIQEAEKLRPGNKS